MQVSGLRMIQNRFDACPVLAAFPSQERYEADDVMWKQKIDSKVG